MSTTGDKDRYPGDLVKDRKSGRKGTYVNEYGTNGRAVIVVPTGMKRSELWDANAIEIIKKVKRPVAAEVLAPQKSLSDYDDDDAVGDDLEVEDDTDVDDS